MKNYFFSRKSQAAAADSDAKSSSEAVSAEGGDGEAIYVFDRELDAIRSRRPLDEKGDAIDIRKEHTDLPDFEGLLVPEEERSTVLNTVLEELQSGDAQAKWDSEKEKGNVLHSGLVGLAFSGGGIRSATFNLGILQGLEKLGLFRCVDYLSTVSGGGYIGSCISSIFATLPEDKRHLLPDELRFPFKHQKGVLEPTVFRHLRNNAEYLAPDGLVDFLRIPMHLLRGILQNFLVVLPYILVASLLTGFVVQTQERLDAYLERGAVPWLGSVGISGFEVTKCLVVLLGLWFLANPAYRALMERLRKVSNWDSRNRYGRRVSIYGIVIGAALLVELQPIAIKQLYGMKANGAGISIFEAGVFGSSIVTLFVHRILPHLGKLTGKIGIYIIGLLGFVVFWLLYLNLCIAIIWGFQPLGFDLALTSWNPVPLLFHPYLVLAAVVAVYGWTTFDANFTGIHKYYRDKLSKAYIIKFKDPVKKKAEADKEGQSSANPPEGDKWVFTDEVEHKDDVRLSQLDSEHAPYHLINTLLNLDKTKESHQNGRHGDFFVFSKYFIGGEITGYCKTKEMEKESPHVDLATAMAISGAAAAPNMGKLTVKPMIFLLAMLNIRLNYWFPNPGKAKKPLLEQMADKLEGKDPNGRKVGAAQDKAIPEWKSQLANQCRSASPYLPTAPWRRVGPVYLIRELFGNLDEKEDYVNLSDGGHIENLGIYELLRRECRLIIAGDGEADKELCFDGLSELIRMALIDFGIKIDVDGLDEIRRGEQHHAIGTIRYANGRIGKLIYLKLSLLGDNNLKSTLDPELYRSSPYRDDNDLFDDNPYIARYKKTHPDFPHQSTADQFFDEAQFESYRALGYEVAMRTLGIR